jgi:hypothetical protein
MRASAIRQRPAKSGCTAKSLIAVIRRRYRPETLAPINNRILPAGLTRVQPKNISIGAQYLTDLFRLFGGDVALTLAG